jgi:hypothetical protein
LKFFDFLFQSIDLSTFSSEFEFFISAEFYGAFLLMISLATIASTFVIQVQSYGQMGKPVPHVAKQLFINKFGRLFAWDFGYFKREQILAKQSAGPKTNGTSFKYKTANKFARVKFFTFHSTNFLYCIFCC